MSGVDWKALLGKVAPVAATFLGGPLAGAVTAQVSQALLGQPDGSDEQLAIALASPDAAIKLRELELAFEQERNRHVEAVLAADNANTQGARDMFAATHDATPRQLAFIVTAVFFTSLMTLFFAPIPTDSMDVAQVLVSQLGAAWLAIMNFYYGTTARSAVRDVMLFQSQAPK